MEINTWFAFVIASLGTLIVPDPSSLLALTHGAIHGYKKHNLLYSAVLWALFYLWHSASLDLLNYSVITSSFLAIKIFGDLYLI